ncbi:MAG: acryloyl-CoA reductase [Planctomycetales bacterium]|nr:acryloyl-CoA reductase [Planctomycetales bacterium]MCA9166738.1 acryloyl-CoA reductase [Planctomycetales bacterium]
MSASGRESFPCYQVQRDEQGQVHGGVSQITRDQLPDGELLIEVQWSSLNYKDGLAALGHPGVARRLPHVPGIDAAGVIVESRNSQWQTGQSVVITGNELGAGQWGGWSRFIQVPANWAVALPEGLSARDAMIYGTAGFTAAQCLRHLIRAEVEPTAGPVLVTGATGGVGCLAVMLLKHLGYEVVASSGKSAAESWLTELGASQVVDRSEVLNSPEKPLASTRWAGVVDTVGGATLAAAIRATGINGCVTACGVVGGAELPLSVYPFILRGVTLAGVTSQNCPLPLRREIWKKLASEWSLPGLDRIANEVTLAEIGGEVSKILAGQIQGRTLVNVGADVA